MAEFVRINLRLNVEDPFHKQALAILETTPNGHKTNVVCDALIFQRNHTDGLALLRDVIREELKGIETTAKKEEVQAESDSVLDFLFSLQEGADP